MANASAKVENGPTDMKPDELAERKRVAAVDYHTRELGLLRDTLAKLEAKADPDSSKIDNQRAMITAAEAALAATEGA